MFSKQIIISHLRDIFSQRLQQPKYAYKYVLLFLFAHSSGTKFFGLRSFEQHLCTNFSDCNLALLSNRTSFSIYLFKRSFSASVTDCFFFLRSLCKHFSASCSFSTYFCSTSILKRSFSQFRVL